MRLTALCGSAGIWRGITMNSSSLPEVSVIIPTYNQAGFLQEALDSLFLQTISHWEVIVVNNFSEDNTDDVLRSYHDERIKVINFRNHGVIAASRNEGVRHARADLIAFLDSDDTWEKEKLERVSAIFRMNPDVDLVCHEKWKLRNGVRKGVLKCGPYHNYNDLLFKYNCLTTSAVTVRRSCFLTVGGFLEAQEFVGVEDYDFWMRLAKAGYRFKFLSEVLGTYRIHEQAYSAQIEINYHRCVNLLQAHFQEWQPQTHYYRNLMRKRLGIALRCYGHRFMLNGEHAKARQYFFLALKKDPLDYKTWALIFLNLLGMRV